MGRPKVAGESAERVVDARNAFIMTNLMRDVVKYGTAAKAMQLGRSDLAGKTGTTNDYIDAWFTGFQPSLVAVAWIGFDEPASLGAGETGSQAALPIWMAYMAKALRGVPEATFDVPEGVVTAAINPNTGLRDDAPGKVSEFFYQEYLPRTQEVREAEAAHPGDEAKVRDEIRNQLF